MYRAALTGPRPRTIECDPRALSPASPDARGRMRPRPQLLGLQYFAAKNNSRHRGGSTPALRHAAIIASASSSVSTAAFSTQTCLPAFAAFIVSARAADSAFVIQMTRFAGSRSSSRWSCILVWQPCRFGERRRVSLGREATSTTLGVPPVRPCTAAATQSPGSASRDPNFSLLTCASSRSPSASRTSRMRPCDYPGAMT